MNKTLRRPLERVFRGPLYRLILLFFFLLTGCERWQGSASQRNRVIVIAIESLNFEMASCLDDSDADDGFDELCQNALRFTHFYSSNPLSQSAMASLLTGLDVQDHKIYSNGNQGIPHTLNTLAERALSLDYRTAFFSGGPPILAKSGLHQGYEEFDDDFLREGRLYRPARENLERAVNWMMDVPKEKALVNIFLSDLQFPFIGTFAPDGKEREKSVTAQKNAVGVALKWFFNELKEKKLWDHSYVVVLGLNGDASNLRKNVLWHDNLFRENIHVPLFIKLPTTIKTRMDSVDSLVSFADVGQLLELMVTSKSTLGVENRIARLKNESHPFIETRSDWRSWWFMQPGLFAVRTYDYLVFPMQKMVIYHTLVDKGEITPLSSAQVGKENIRWLTYQGGESSESATDINADLFAFLEFLHNERQAKNVGLLSQLSPSFNTLTFSLKVAADKALHNRDTVYLQKYMETSPFSLGCQKLYNDKKKQKETRHHCKDSLFLALLDWETALGGDSFSSLEKNFIRLFRAHIQNKQTAYVNLFLELNWDVNVLEFIGPSLTEIYLSQNEKAHLRKKIEEYRVPLYASLPQE